MSNQSPKPPPSEDDVLRRMLNTPPQPHNVTTTKEAVDRSKRLRKESAKLIEQSREMTRKKPKKAGK